MIMHRILSRLLSISAPFVSDEFYIKNRFRIVMGYKLNINNPQTFCEKIQWLKLHRKRRDFTQMVDKIDVKEFVTGIIGSKHIIPTIGTWNRFDEIDFNSLPDEFIIKCTHNSSKGVICHNKNELDIDRLRKRMLYYQKENYFILKREYPYKEVPHRFIAEKFLVNGNDKELKDYKFYCFNGKAEYCQLIANRSSDETIDFYDRNWSHQEFIGLVNSNEHHSLILEKRPPQYDKMLEIADKIAKAIAHPFVRVDLYNVKGEIYFGEITFFPASGMGTFTPKEWDKKLGDMIDLNWGGMQINSNLDFKYFIHQDKTANNYSTTNIKKRIKQILLPNPIVAYLLALRKAEYYTNVHHFAGGFLRLYWRRKLQKLGVRLGFSIPVNTCGPGLSLPHYGNIVINHNAKIGANCRIHSGVNIGASGGSKKAPHLGDNVYIAPGAILFGDIHIGSNNTIGANATVNKSFTEENVVIAGTPAKIVKEKAPNWIEFNNKAK